MPGVIRPYTLTDVLATINQNQGGQNATTGNSATSFGVIAEVDDTVTPLGDSATAAHSPPPGWDSGFWGATGWQ
jgi:hypothetical protein